MIWLCDVDNNYSTAPRRRLWGSFKAWIKSLFGPAVTREYSCEDSAVGDIDPTSDVLDRLFPFGEAPAVAMSALCECPFDGSLAGQKRKAFCDVGSLDHFNYPVALTFECASWQRCRLRFMRTGDWQFYGAQPPAG